jgi:propionyl-CoA carboxylase beta chain
MWDESVFQNYKKIKEEIQLGGGIDRIKKQHEKGKLTARERIDLLLDEKSFHEVDDMILSRTTDFDMEKKRKYGDGVVVGYGKIHGRTVYIASQDFTVSGGAGGERYALKICHILEMAISTRNPIIYLNDSGGARIEEGICSLSAYSRLFYLNTIASGVIPQIALILGPCAGGASYSPALCDFIFMLENKSEMYLTGPKVVEVTLGEKVSSNDLGGSKVHTEISGVAHFLCKDAED